MLPFPLAPRPFPPLLPVLLPRQDTPMHPCAPQDIFGHVWIPPHTLVHQHQSQDIQWTQERTRSHQNPILLRNTLGRPLKVERPSHQILFLQIAGCEIVVHHWISQYILAHSCHQHLGFVAQEGERVKGLREWRKRRLRRRWRKRLGKEGLVRREREQNR